MKAPKSDPVELALSALLDVLAPLLIPLDITPQRLTQIARASFVKAGASAARKRSSGRPHLARIAALTGLSRTEVKRIVAANYQFKEQELEHAPRALRVLDAWRHSAPFSIKGRPRVLRITGPTPSFESLCKQYSGDIPSKVILNELLHRKNVSLRKGKASVGVRRHRTTNPTRQRDLSTLLFAANLLAELADDNRILVRRKERITAPTKIATQYVENSIVSKVSSMLDHLPSIFANKKSSSRKKVAVNVFAVIARPRPLKKKERE